MTFPERFLWGISSSGFQFEMGDPSKTGLDENTDWYAWVHDRNNIQKKVVSGDFPEDGPNYWTLFKEDHQIASGLGLNCNRIGIEWSRVFPKSTRGVEVDVERADDGRIAGIAANEHTMETLERLADVSAVSHYREIVSDLRQRNLRPIVCLNHFTLPIWIHDPLALTSSRHGGQPRGWYDEETVVEFWKFAAYVAWKLGDLVDSWVTLNEPVIVAEGYRRVLTKVKRIKQRYDPKHIVVFEPVEYLDQEFLPKRKEHYKREYLGHYPSSYREIEEFFVEKWKKEEGIEVLFWNESTYHVNIGKLT